MTKTEIKRLMNLPPNVIPSTKLMVDVILTWMNDVSHKDEVIQTNGVAEIHSYYVMAMDYYRTIWNKPKATAHLLENDVICIDRLEE